MASSSSPQVKEFTLEQDCELRFEIESKNEKVKLEVSENRRFLWKIH